MLLIGEFLPAECGSSSETAGQSSLRQPLDTLRVRRSQ
jgi:hypothetical protein